MADYSLSATASWTAAVRAQESARDDRLFNDPWAATLAGPVGAAWIAGRAPNAGLPMVLRTRFFDDYLQAITRQRSIRQIVLLAAGLDTRAFRLDWPAGTRFYELDQPDVLGYKEQALSAAGAQARCERHVIAADLTGPWAARLAAEGFDPAEPTGWLLEGFLFYVPNDNITAILDELTRLAARGSRLGFDIVNGVTLTHPLTKPWIDMQAAAGAPWVGTLDDPQGFLAARGWTSTLSQAGAADANHGRWPFPVIPTTMPGMPHNWYVTAEKP